MKNKNDYIKRNKFDKCLEFTQQNDKFIYFKDDQIIKIYLYPLKYSLLIQFYLQNINIFSLKQ